MLLKNLDRVSSCRATFACRSGWIALAVLIPVVMMTSSCAAQPPGNSVTFAPRTLRGYGSVRGTYTRIPSIPGGSLLQIDCDSEAKAKLLQAKYISDVGLMPGVTETVLAGTPKIQAHVIANSGAVAALQSGGKVLIASATNASDIPRVLQSGFSGDLSSAVSIAQIPVPMYLDRWDKYGFRFYYTPWQVPRGADPRTYDVNQEFDWAKRMGTGLVFWADMNKVDTADGLSNEVWWSWAIRAARQHDLPFGINDTLGGNINRYRFQQQEQMPQYVGDFFAIASQTLGGQGLLSYNATTGLDEALGQIQVTIKQFNPDPHIVSWLEPHGELDKGPQNIFQEYGPVADVGFRKFLQGRYPDVATVSKRWYGDAGHIRSWDEIRVPELASFMGWGPEAIDLAGQWRIAYEPFIGQEIGRAELEHALNRKEDRTQPAPREWFSPNFDDSSWPTLNAPGNDKLMFLPKRPAVYRRTFDIPATWLAQHKKVWLYVWDLSLGAGASVHTVLNGVELPDSPVIYVKPHWMGLDVSSAVKEGKNVLAIRLPKGYLAYRTYLSPDPPRQYPYLGPTRNAQWADFFDFTHWCRVDAARRGIEMIRQADPDRNISIMEPDEFTDMMKTVASEYGAEFHNTGYMGGFYADLDPMMMQGSDLPTSVEPGAAPRDVAGFDKMMGQYYSEGVQGVDYFIHIGDVLWNDAVRARFEQTRNLTRLIGKYHSPKAEVGILMSYGPNRRTGYPWSPDANDVPPGGYWSMNVGMMIQDLYHRDGLTESDFAAGNAAAYRAIIDTNSVIMDPETVSQIDDYVRNGGTFITFGQTGRHTSVAPDTWPISRLTGYRVTHIDQVTEDGRQKETRSVAYAPGQDIIGADLVKTLNIAKSHGISMKAEASDCQNLLLWSDGSTAVGYRKIGKGMIITVGCNWSANYTDKVEALLDRLLQWRGIRRLPGSVDASIRDVMMRHFVSNNGLFDVWTLWNRSSSKSQTVRLTLASDLHPRTATDVETGRNIPVSADGRGDYISGISLAPYETKILLTPRTPVEAAPVEWFALQRNWWRGTRAPEPKELPRPTQRLAMDLTSNWHRQAISDPNQAESLVQAKISPEAANFRLDVANVATEPEAKHALYIRTFQVPEHWRNGDVRLWIQSYFATTFSGQARVFLDGKMIQNWSSAGIRGDDVGGALAPGSSHTIGVEIRGDSSLVGSRGACWISWKPAPAASMDLAGSWSSSEDLLHYDKTMTIPGSAHTFALRRDVQVPAAYAGKNVLITVDKSSTLAGILINGQWIRRNVVLDTWSLNITPWMQFGKVNQIELMPLNGPADIKVNGVKLEAYDPQVYP